jgi:hypothetical protein
VQAGARPVRATSAVRTTKTLFFRSPVSLPDLSPPSHMAHSCRKVDCLAWQPMVCSLHSPDSIIELPACCCNYTHAYSSAHPGPVIAAAIVINWSGLLVLQSGMRPCLHTLGSIIPRLVLCCVVLRQRRCANKPSRIKFGHSRPKTAQHCRGNGRTSSPGVCEKSLCGRTTNNTICLPSASQVLNSLSIFLLPQRWRVESFELFLGVV